MPSMQMPQQQQEGGMPYYMRDSEVQPAGSGSRASSPLLGMPPTTVGYLPPPAAGIDAVLHGGYASHSVPMQLPQSFSAARSQAFGMAAMSLPLSAHAFPPTVSPEQHASLSVAVAARQPQQRVQRSANAPSQRQQQHQQQQHQQHQMALYGSSTPPMSMQQPAHPSPRPAGRYHSPGSTPTARSLHHYQHQQQQQQQQQAAFYPQYASAIDSPMSSPRGGGNGFDLHIVPGSTSPRLFETSSPPRHLSRSHAGSLTNLHAAAAAGAGSSGMSMPCCPPLHVAHVHTGDDAGAQTLWHCAVHPAAHSSEGSIPGGFKCKAHSAASLQPPQPLRSGSSSKGESSDDAG